MPTYATCQGPSCTRSLLGRRATARYCRDACRSAGTRARLRDADAAREEAFRLLLEHGAEIRASISSGVEPDRARLDDLAAHMDVASRRAEALLRR